MLVVLLALVVPALLSALSGADSPAFAGAWSGTHAGSGVVPWLLLVSAASRTVLVLVAWSPWFERLYPRLAFPLVAVCHTAWTFVCSGEVLGAHPEYLAPLVTDAFAAYFFSGLLFRQALVVNLAAATGFVAGGWHHAGELAPVFALGMHLFTNIVMGSIAGFAHERSLRGLFLEHSLLADMAARDGLTGLRNRRAFDEHFARVWQQGLHSQRRLGILMIDVDEFKDYNDRYGHQAGDLALQRIAEAVSRLAVGPLDLAARYGGEEFAVILYQPSYEHMVSVAEALRSTVHTLAIEHRGGRAGIVTASVGAAVVRPTAQRSPQGALQLADQALYNAKREGRDRVDVLEDEYNSLTTGVFGAIAQTG